MLPSAKALRCWSDTLYDPDGYQVANPLNRFAVMRLTAMILCGVGRDRGRSARRTVSQSGR